jgi:hypothetical protein
MELVRSQMIQCCNQFKSTTVLFASVVLQQWVDINWTCLHLTVFLGMCVVVLVNHVQNYARKAREKNIIKKIDHRAQNAMTCLSETLRAWRSAHTITTQLADYLTLVRLLIPSLTGPCGHTTTMPTKTILTHTNNRTTLFVPYRALHLCLVFAGRKHLCLSHG